MRRSWRFPDGGEAELDIDDAMRIENFIVDAPPASPEFWSGLFQILKTLPATLYGEGAGIAVAQPTMAAHIGADMVEEFGAPKLVASAEELRALFPRSTPPRHNPRPSKWITLQVLVCRAI